MKITLLVRLVNVGQYYRLIPSRKGVSEAAAFRSPICSVSTHTTVIRVKETKGNVQSPLTQLLLELKRLKRMFSLHSQNCY